jgi:hypothetical protein
MGVHEGAPRGIRGGLDSNDVVVRDEAPRTQAARLAVVVTGA